MLAAHRAPLPLADLHVGSAEDDAMSWTEVMTDMSVESDGADPALDVDVDFVV